MLKSIVQQNHRRPVWMGSGLPNLLDGPVGSGHPIGMLHLDYRRQTLLNFQSFIIQSVCLGFHTVATADNGHPPGPLQLFGQPDHKRGLAGSAGGQVADRNHAGIDQVGTFQSPIECLIANSNRDTINC